MKLLIGGSPCTYWSIAQTKNRETEASGMGWELFRNYVIARDKMQPDYFLYENNKSMSPAIRAQITEMLGVEPVLINSALVSAQNRQRLYWCGKREADGSYSTVPIEQPEDRDILLRDVLESGVIWREKGITIDANYYKGGNLSGFRRQSGMRLMVAEPVKPLSDREMDYMVRETHDGRNHFDYGYVQDGTQDKGKCVTANISKGVPYNVLCEPVCVASRGRYIGEGGSVAQHYEVQESGKTNTLTTVQKDNLVAEPIAMRQVGRRINADGHRADYDESIDLEQRYEVNDDPQKTNCLSTVSKDNMIAEPVNDTDDGKCHTIKAQYYKNGVANFVTNGGFPASAVAEPVRIGTIENDTKAADFDSQQYRVYSPDGKSVTLCGNGGGVGVKTGLYACPEKDGTPIYEVKDGFITIKGKQYPIKLRDGYYIIRKLTVRECMRLQTVPEDYEFPVSNSQAYKMLGNGWTVDVIVHLLSHFDGIMTEPVDVLSMYDGMACGHIALDKLGANIRNYYATEIDKYAIKTALHNFPDIVELGDANQIRDQWRHE